MPPEQERSTRKDATGSVVGRVSEEQLAALQRAAAGQQREMMQRIDALSENLESQVRSITRGLDGLSASQTTMAPRRGAVLTREEDGSFKSGQRRKTFTKPESDAIARSHLCATRKAVE